MGGKAVMREGNMSLWQVQVLSHGQNTPDSRLIHSPFLQYCNSGLCGELGNKHWLAGLGPTILRVNCT